MVILSRTEAAEPTQTEKNWLSRTQLIEDGATQIGIGGIPNVVLNNLTNHNDWVFTPKMFSDGILPLVERINTGEDKKLNEEKLLPALPSAHENCMILDDNLLFI